MRILSLLLPPVIKILSLILPPRLLVAYGSILKNWWKSDGLGRVNNVSTIITLFITRVKLPLYITTADVRLYRYKTILFNEINLYGEQNDTCRWIDDDSDCTESNRSVCEEKFTSFGIRIVALVFFIDRPKLIAINTRK